MKSEIKRGNSLNNPKEIIMVNKTFLLTHYEALRNSLSDHCTNHCPNSKIINDLDGDH